MKEKTKEKTKSSFKVVPKGEDRCIWMEAGVLDYKLCNNNYNCHTCAFDKAMKETADENTRARTLGLEPTGKKAHIVTWQEKMKQRQGLERRCRHTVTGRAPLRLCPYDYECGSCMFDQMLEDSFELQLPFRVTNIASIDGYRFPDGHFLHEGHTWARVEQGGRVRIGMDDFSMRLFGPVDKFDLPLTGEQVTIGETGFAFKRGGKDAEVLAPVTGIVAAVNNGVATSPGLVKDEPYNEGWIMVIEPAEMKRNLKGLMFGKQTAEWIRWEHQKLMGLVSGVGLSFADGGAVEDVVGKVPSLPWTLLRKEFLRS